MDNRNKLINEWIHKADHDVGIAKLAIEHKVINLFYKTAIGSTGTGDGSLYHLYFLKPFIFKSFRAPSGMPFKRTLISKKTAIRYPVFGVFLPSQNFKTLINSHF